ncbi:MAG: cell wall hydrolase [Lachnospiraceae bacterium]|nr:cell wall hydrolase [Candidatus Colinaster equi]
MKQRGRKLLRGLMRICIGVATVGMIRSTNVYANTTNNPLQDINGGAASILDALDRGDAQIDVSSVLKDESGDSKDDESEGHKSDLVMANVVNSLNVREEASEESGKVGLLYADCGGKILDADKDWTKIQSGELIGWCKNDYLLFDEEAEELAQSVGRTIATVDTDALRVRKEAMEDAGVWGLVKRGDEIEAIVEDTTDDWVAIDFEGEEGYISAEYVKVEFSVDCGETYEAIEERERREQEEKAKLKKNLGAVAVDAPDEALLAALVYCESGNQPYEGQLAVASVVMNRVRSGAYPNSVSGVIYASGQFAPALNGKVAAQLSVGVPATCTQAAREAIAGNTNIGGATHFKRWSGQPGVVIGAHVFY